MNMILSQTTVATGSSTSFRARPKGMEEPIKMQPKEQVVGKIPAMLVSAFDVSTISAMRVAHKVYDGYTTFFGTPPANVEYIRAAIATPKGRAWLDGLIAALPQERPLPAVPKADTPTPVAKAPAPAPVVWTNDHLSAASAEEMTAALLAAVKSGDEAKVDDVLKRIVEACPEGYFVTPFQNWTRVAGMLIGRRNDMKRRGLVGNFVLHWTDGGFGDGVLPGKPMAPKKAVSIHPTPQQKPKRTRAEQAAITAANRAARHAAQPTKGKTCGSGGNSATVKQGKGKGKK